MIREACYFSTTILCGWAFIMDAISNQKPDVTAQCVFYACAVVIAISGTIIALLFSPSHFTSGSTVLYWHYVFCSKIECSASRRFAVRLAWFCMGYSIGSIFCANCVVECFGTFQNSAYVFTKTAFC